MNSVWITAIIMLGIVSIFIIIFSYFKWHASYDKEWNVRELKKKYEEYTAELDVEAQGIHEQNLKLLQEREAAVNAAMEVVVEENKRLVEQIESIKRVKENFEEEEIEFDEEQ